MSLEGVKYVDPTETVEEKNDAPDIAESVDATAIKNSRYEGVNKTTATKVLENKFNGQVSSDGETIKGFDFAHASLQSIKEFNDLIDATKDITTVRIENLPTNNVALKELFNTDIQNIQIMDPSLSNWKDNTALENIADAANEKNPDGFPGKIFLSAVSTDKIIANKDDDMLTQLLSEKITKHNIVGGRTNNTI